MLGRDSQSPNNRSSESNLRTQNILYFFMFSIKTGYYSGQIMRVEKFLLVGALGRKCAVDNHR